MVNKKAIFFSLSNRMTLTVCHETITHEGNMHSFPKAFLTGFFLLQRAKNKLFSTEQFMTHYTGMKKDHLLSASQPTANFVNAMQMFGCIHSIHF